jgi:hypothetical protein
MTHSETNPSVPATLPPRVGAVKAVTPKICPPVPAPGTDAYETAVTAFYTGVSALQVGENFRAEQQSGASADQKALELMPRLQALRPDNLLALVETARLADKAGDAQILRSVLVHKTGPSIAACNNGNKAAFH